MNYISESAIIENIAQKILQPKRMAYSEEPIYMALSYFDDSESVDSLVYNKYNQKLKVTLFFNRKTQHQICLVYMHGFGSNRTQALFLLKYLPENISLCCFDFSAEGKSEGKIVTYGHKEKDDIRAVLGYLRTCGYKTFILWGRSMGATCTLLFSIKEKPEDVLLQILDSPFISFQSAAFQLTKSKINTPQLLIKIALEVLKTNLSTKEYNPFEIDLNKPIKCSIPTIFIYSENDEIISSENSKKIIRNFSGYFEKIIIKQRHNAVRKHDTILELIDKIKRHLSKKNFKNPHEKVKQKFLLDVCYKKRSLNNNHESFENYGISVSSKTIQQNNKFQCENSNPSQKGEQNLLTRSQILPTRRPRSSIKVYSKYQKSKQLGKFIFQENIIVENKLNHRLSLTRPKRNVYPRLSHQLYL